MQFWWVVTIILTTAFGAKLVSILSVQKAPVRFDRLEDYLRNPDAKLLLESESALMERLKVTTCPLGKSAWDEVASGRGAVVTSEEAIRLIENDPNFVLFKDVSPFFMHYGPGRQCTDQSFYYGKAKYLSSSLAFPIREGSRLAPKVNECLQIAMETGIVQYIESGYLSNVCRASNRATIRISMIHFEGAFYMLYIGLSLAVTVLGIERVVQICSSEVRC